MVVELTIGSTSDRDTCERSRHTSSVEPDVAMVVSDCLSWWSPVQISAGCVMTSLTMSHAVGNIFSLFVQAVAADKLPPVIQTRRRYPVAMSERTTPRSVRSSLGCCQRETMLTPAVPGAP